MIQPPPTVVCCVADSEEGDLWVFYVVEEVMELQSYSTYVTRRASYSWAFAGLCFEGSVSFVVGCSPDLFHKIVVA